MKVIHFTVDSSIYNGRRACGIWSKHLNHEGEPDESPLDRQTTDTSRVTCLRCRKSSIFKFERIRPKF